MRQGTTLVIHRSLYPETDYGATWLEQCWIETDDGERVTAILPTAGGTERLGGGFPGGPFPPIRHLIELERERCVGGKAARIERRTEVHGGRWTVGPVAIAGVRS